MRITIEETIQIGDDMYCACGCIYEPLDIGSTKKEERYEPIRFSRYCPIPPKALLGKYPPFIVCTRPDKDGIPEIVAWNITPDNDEVSNVGVFTEQRATRKGSAC